MEWISLTRKNYWQKCTTTGKRPIMISNNFCKIIELWENQKDILKGEKEIKVQRGYYHA